jgi:hypothetical protein
VLKQEFLAGVRDAIGQPAGIHDLMGSRGTADILLQGKERMKAKILELTELYGAAGRAENW